MKKLTTICVALALLGSLAGCGGSKTAPTSSGSSHVPASEHAVSSQLAPSVLQALIKSWDDPAQDAGLADPTAHPTAAQSCTARHATRFASYNWICDFSGTNEAQSQETRTYLVDLEASSCWKAVGLWEGKLETAGGVSGCVGNSSNAERSGEREHTPEEEEGHSKGLERQRGYEEEEALGREKVEEAENSSLEKYARHIEEKVCYESGKSSEECANKYQR